MAVRPNLKAAVGLILLLLSGTVSAQNFSAGVNTENPNPRAVLHLVSPNGDQGLLIPQLTTAQRTSMAGGLNAQSNGLLVYDNEQGLFYFWLNSGWIALSVTDNQTLAVSGTNLTIQNGNSVDLAATGFLLAETDPTVPDAIKDGIDWTELTNIPAGFADGVDEVGSSAGDGTTILGDGNTTPFSVGVIDIAQVTGLATIAASGSFNDLADVPANLDVDNTDDLSTSAVPAPGDVSGSFALGLVVDQVGGQSAAAIGTAVSTIATAPSLDIDTSDDLTTSAVPAPGDVSGSFALGLVVDQVGGEAAADVGAATFFVINNPSIDPDFSDDLTLSDTPSGGDVSGDFGTGLVVDFVGSETASDVATATALVIANPTLDLDATDDFDGAYGSLTGVSVVNADVNAAAAIAGTKINPNFGTQNISTTGSVTAGSFVGNGSGLTGVPFTELDPTVPANIKDGVDWTELTGIPVGFADDTDDGVTDLTSFDTDDLTEGAGNFYYTDARVGTYLTGSSVTQFSDVTNAGSGQIITGAERTLLGTALQTEADPTVLASVKDGVDWTELTGIPVGFADDTDDGVTDLTSFDTDDLTEGAGNFYYTDTRVGTYLTGSSVTQFSDVTNAGSGQIITGAERTLLGTALQTEADPVWVADRTILGSVGTINTGGNLIDWSQLKGVPTAFSDGVDDGVTDLTSFDTDDLTEGAGNFYYTDARVGTYLTGSSVTQFTDVTNAGSGQIITGAERTLLGTALQTELDPVWVADRTILGSVGSINTGGNLIDWSQLKGVPTAFSDGVDDGVTDLTSFDTDDLTEGAGNFYYTDARVGTYLTGSSVTQFSDITNAGSGQIITGAERTLLGTALQTEADPVWVADRTTLGSVGTINTGGNLIDWSQLKGVPTDFSDGVDEGSTLVDGSIWVGNAGLPSAVTMSGDITLSNTGVATIAANAVDNTKIAATTITNSEISVTAAIAGAKITPDFGTQNIITSGNIQLTTSPTAGYVLTSDATGVGTWQPGSFALPYTNAVADINALFDLDNTGTGPAARFANTFTNGTAVLVAGNIAFEENLTRKIAIQDNLAAAGDDLEVAAGNSLFAGANGGVLNLRGGNATTGNGGNISLEPGTSAGTNGWIDMRGVARFGQVSATQSGRLEIEDNVGTGRVSINGAAVITSYNLSLPGANGTGALTNDGSGALTWNPAGAGNYIIDANENQKGGASAASATTTGAQNIVLGNLSASALTVGNGNIVAGYSGAVSLVGGSDNLVIGRLADVTGDGSNNVVLGDNADAAGSNSVVIGASASASGNLAIAIGENTQANGVRSMAFGAGTIATTAQTAIIGDGISNNTTFDVGIGTNAPTGRLGVATLVGEANKNGIVISQNAALGAGLIVDLTDVGNSNDAVIVDNAGSARAAVFRNTNVGNVASTLVVENAAAGSGLQVDKTTDGNAIEVNYSGTTTGSGLLVNMNLAGTDPAILVTNSSAAGSIVADGNISTSAAVNTNDLSVGGSSIHNGPFITPPPVTNQTVVASLPTPGSRIVRLVAGGTINAIGAGQNGQELILINAGPAVTVNDGATIFLNNNNTFNMSTTSTLHLIYDLGLGAWIEIGRSLNQ